MSSSERTKKRGETEQSLLSREREALLLRTKERTTNAEETIDNDLGRANPFVLLKEAVAASPPSPSSHIV